MIDELLANNRRYAEDFRHGALPARPAKRLAVLACMDARVLPSRILGLAEGDAHIIKNAGGIVTDDAIRSLAISQHVLGTERVVVIQHTDCGMQNAKDEEILDRLERETGRRPSWAPGTFESVEESVRDAVEAIRQNPFVPGGDRVRGFVYEVETGRLREVVVPR